MRRRWPLLLLLCLLLTGCSTAASGGRLIPAAEGAGTYSGALHPFLAGYGIEEVEDSLYAEVSRGNTAACFDVQAIPAMARGIGRYWYPHVSATVVLAVDRTRTDAVITGWNSLRESGAPVGVSTTSIIRNMLVMGALAYGLDRKEPAKQDALEFLEYLYQHGGFEIEGSDAPVLLCLDYEAAAWNRQGGAYEIIVPEEGTLSYRLGLLSEVPLTLEPGLDEALLAAGLPLSSGERPEGFPEEYGSARTLGEKDYDWFLEVAGDSSRDLRRQVFHTRLYTTADLREHILSALLITAAILLWKGTVSHRMVRRDIRLVVDLLGWLMVGWLLLRLFKYQLAPDGLPSRMCWYGYYLFQLALPVALLYLATILDRAEGERTLVRPLWPPLVCYVLSVLLVLTNDVHQLVFRFAPEGNWASDYRYGPGYWIIMAGFLLFLAAAVWKLFRKGRRSASRRGRVVSLLFCAGLVVYLAAYVKRVPLAWESDFTVNICILSALFFEATLHARLVPVNLQYQRLFASAPISLTLLDESGRTVLASRGVRPVSHSVWKRLRMDMEQPLLRDSNTQFHAVPIHGGMAVWQEDLSQLNRLRREIQDVQVRLEAANALLREEGEVKKRLLTAETKRRLFEQLDRDMERRVASLARLIKTLPSADHPRGLTAYITLCLCHIKRSCNLFFLARQGEPLQGEELSVYLDELAELARYAGLQMLIRCGQSGALEIRRAALCYDFGFETISWALREEASPLMGYLEPEGDRLVFRFLPGRDPGQWHFSEELLSAVARQGGQILCKDLDDAVGIYMTLPLGGEVYG
ncbi:MAG: histidine kinase N-terminal 7TM domain-containing protein [Evtepia sp.]|uniref:histidine kinase N-terminal 7TM domain-containing protein n=1 Tax=Evtepia sp. TaxID=2773933 RepID=UPI002A75499E|nr:histidine kinase N-terminal 7TM domain-containing protein [Evtepia sp.]MDY3014611.1 histidine kinase N-terminal 7TM domain-containing protein [Evtepia sp.]